jgi:hypothetical protein
MPHMVVGDPSQSRVKVGAGNRIAEEYLGVLIKDAPDELTPGSSAELTLVFMYWPEENYSSVRPGATFTLREGPKIVGFGEIISTHTAPS